MPAVTMISIWRNDADRQLETRAHHLLSKHYPSLRFMWVVGDSDSMTRDMLWDIYDERRTIIDYDTGIVGDDSNPRLWRMGQTFNAGLNALWPSDDVVVAHESDLISPVDVVERLLAIPGDVAAGWPVLGGAVFDTF